MSHIPSTPPPIAASAGPAGQIVEAYVPPPGVFRTPRALRSWTMGLLLANGLIEVLNFGHSGFTLSFLASAKEDGSADQDVGMLIDLTAGLLGLGGIAVYIATVVVFCCWFHRINKNAALVATEKPPMSPGLAVGSFFIPILCVFYPCKAALFSWKSSARAVDPQSPASATIVGVWWATWILVNVVGRIVFKQAFSTGFSQEAPSIEELERTEYVLMVGNVAGLLSAAVATVMVAKMTALQARVEAFIERSA